MNKFRCVLGMRGTVNEVSLTVAADSFHEAQQIAKEQIRTKILPVLGASYTDSQEYEVRHCVLIWES